MRAPLLIRRLLARLGISGALSAAIVFGVGIFALVSSFGVSWVGIHDARRNLETQGALLAERFADQSVLALLYGSAENARDAADNLLGFPQVTAVGVYDTAGEPLLETRNLAAGPIPSAPAARGGRIEHQTGSEWIFLAPVYSGDAEAPASPFDTIVTPELIGYVRVVQSKAPLRTIAQGVVLSNLAISLGIAVVLAFLGHAAARRITDPVQALAAAMKRAQAGDTGVRAQESGPLELRIMERAFNRMMEVLEQREAELRTAHGQALDAARTKAQFAAHVSHELRTPLNGLMGMLQLLEGAGEDKRQEYLRAALSSGRSLLAVINDILDFSRGDAGRIQLEARTFALPARIVEVTDVLQPMARAKDITLQSELAPNLPAAVVGDPTRLGQILTNLIGNAIKFTVRGGITVRVTRKGNAPGDVAALLFEVEDSGVGIAPEEQARIFESFTQATPATAGEFGGSGLGLTISRQLVELMGGSIGVRSTPGVGSTFWFTVALPVASPAGAGARALEGKRVLVAARSDDLAIPNLVQRLESLGAAVTWKSSGGELLLALARGGNEAFGAVLVAPELSEMQGAELVRYLIRLPGRERYRVLTLTSGESRQATQPGFDGQLPINAPATELARLLGVPEPAQHTGPARILVAEDDATSRMVAQGLIEAAGFAVDCVEDGQAALAALARRSYDLVLMDVNMPVLDGLAATRELRKRGGPLPPVIAMTANTQPEDVARTRAAGMNDFIAKPVEASAINAILSRWLGRQAETELPAPSGAPLEGVLDEAVFDSLKAALGSRIGAITETFLADAADLIRDLAARSAENDRGAVRDLAHRLKGAARNVGALHVAAGTERIEQAARSGEVPLAAELLDALQTALEATAAALEGRVGQSVPATPAAAEGPVVLVVEDDRSTRMTLRALLEDDGYRVVEAGDGREALALLERHRPELVLLDAMLPVQDGFTTCREITQRSDAARVPVLMITSLDDEVSVERAFRAGAADFIPKPLNLSVLSRRVQRLVHAHTHERDAQRLAYHDTLTGLINRGAFRERLEHSLPDISGSQLQTVLYLDLDRFKRVNDTLGHDAGDELLSATAARLRDVLPEAATLARVGSDEFAATFTVRGADEAGQQAQRVIAALAAPLRVSGRELRMGASVGIALAPTDATDVDSLIKFAETAAARAKEEGGNAAHFYQARMSTALRERVELETDLRKAIEREQLVLFYQPQVELASGRVRGVEALVRWRHPQRGLVPPSEFIPLAEESGLIGMLGEWVLRAACVQAMHWRERGMEPLRIGVNLSVRQLAAPEFLDVVAHALRETALEPALLELEVTESVLMRDREGARDLLARLRKLGVRIAIDDFGTGYSSLGYLKHLPVDTLKLDRTFVSGLPMDPHDVAITTGVLNLARSLHLEVVAEGVETGAQMRFLREYGCSLAQGYLIHAPVPASAFEAWLAARPAQRRGSV